MDDSFPRVLSSTGLVGSPTSLSLYRVDDDGQYVFMRYVGPVPHGQDQSRVIYMVTHSTPSDVHRADRWVYQRYSKIEG